MYDSSFIVGSDHPNCLSSLVLDVRTRDDYRHGFSRIDHDNTDNTIKHLISYSDANTGYSASRCHYCCWGCGGWRETIVWASRPHQPE